MDDRRPCEMEYACAPEHVYVRDNMKESVAEKGGGEGAGRRRWDIVRGGVVSGGG